MFIDEAIVEVVGGNGGNGCLAFRHEKYIEMGGPFGGNGGNGGNVVFEADEGLNTLIDLRYKKRLKADNGAHGEGKGCHGKNAPDLIVKVPVGTVVLETDSDFVIGDLTKHGQRCIVASGGRGGRGNMAFVTKINKAPDFAENGEPGEDKKVKVELKLLADVGLVGMPSVGKSTFISMISAAKPKIAAYHFTTLSPNLGVTKTKDGRSFVVADLPGLIEGASLGEGLGDKFLKHIERTRVIAHIIDMSGFEGRDPYDDYVIINKELENFNKNVALKPQIVIANKMDIEGASKNLEEFKKKVAVPVYPISAALNQGLDEVLIKLADMLDSIKKEPLYQDEKFEDHVLYKFKSEQPFKIIKENEHTYVVKGDEIEKIYKMTWFVTDEAFKRFSNKLRKLGIDDKLKEMGIQNGDTIKILDYEFEYQE